MPFVDIHHAVAPVDFDDRRDQRDHSIADFLDVRAFVHRQTIGKLHQRRGRASFRRMNRSGDVIDRDGLRDDFVGFGVVHLQQCADQPVSPACARFSSSFFRFSSDDTATAIISRPSSVVPIEKTFTRGLAFSSMRMYLYTSSA